MKNAKTFAILLTAIFLSLILISCGGQTDASSESGSSYQVEPLTDEARACVECHATETHGIVADWDNSRHADEGISCIDCHETDIDSPMALDNVKDHDDVSVAVSLLVPPSVCERCHEDQVAQFDNSGHFRAHLQRIPKEGLTTLVQTHEGRDHPEFGNAPDETGCMQCHGIDIVVGEDGRPTSETYPTAGIGNVYPDGDVGNCTVCHSRHSFDIAEARKPEACGGCHIGPDHPDLEIFENTKHGQIFHTEGEEWTWDSPPGEWEPGDYRAPTCATCHMSGIGDLQTTHNVSERLYWNLWAKVSKPRTETDVMDMFYGDAEAGRALMKAVCNECHTSTHTDTYFESGDKAVNLYNEAYWKPAEAMRLELAEKGLLKENPWTDEFQIIHYYLWHHEGRRARQGSMMGAPDWAHWHGFFDLQQDLYKLQVIYEQRIETGVIED